MQDTNSQIARAHNTVKEDYSILQKQLYEGIKNGADNSHTKFKPCTAALKRFEKFAVDSNLKLDIRDGIITLERNKTSRILSYVP